MTADTWVLYVMLGLIVPILLGAAFQRLWWLIHSEKPDERPMAHKR